MAQNEIKVHQSIKTIKRINDINNNQQLPLKIDHPKGQQQQD